VSKLVQIEAEEETQTEETVKKEDNTEESTTPKITSSVRVIKAGEQDAQNTSEQAEDGESEETETIEVEEVVVEIEPQNAGKSVFKEIKYYDGDKELTGLWLESACEKTAGGAPTIIIAPQTKGPGQHEQDVADALSKNCYNSFSMDIFGERKIIGDDKIRGIIDEYLKDTPEKGFSRLQAAINVAKEQTTTDPSKIAVIGYAMGGIIATNYALNGAQDIVGVVSFHPDTNYSVNNIQAGVNAAPILIHVGAEDSRMTEEDLRNIEQKAGNAGIDLKTLSYEGANRSFTIEAARTLKHYYHPDSDRKSWYATLEFLNKVFQ
jgi:dienelactone hydrolase